MERMRSSRQTFHSIRPSCVLQEIEDRKTSVDSPLLSPEEQAGGVIFS
jgi:hypothetical protein